MAVQDCRFLRQCPSVFKQLYRKTSKRSFTAMGDMLRCQSKFIQDSESKSTLLDVKLTKKKRDSQRTGRPFSARETAMRTDGAFLVRDGSYTSFHVLSQMRQLLYRSKNQKLLENETRESSPPFLVNVGIVIGMEGTVILLGLLTSELSSYGIPEHLMRCLRI